MSRAVMVLVSCTTFMGCIITREPSYSEPPNTPAVIFTSSPGDTPLNRVLRVSTSDLTGADGGVVTSVSFAATLRDPDIGQPLVGLVWVDFNADDMAENFPVLQDGDVTITTREDDATLRDVSFDVQITDLVGKDCRAVELRVSEQFTGFPPREVPGDLGTAVWWVMVTENPGDPAEMNDCLFEEAR